MNFPSISIVSGLYNTDLGLWKQTLVAIKKQQYPKEKIEHIVMDAGSNNGSVEVAKLFGCKVTTRRDLIDQGPMRMSLGISQAQGDLILLLEPDNVIPTDCWLGEMVLPFTEHDAVVASYSMYNTFERSMPMLTKYCALMGTSDPTVYYLGKSEKMPLFKKQYELGQILAEHPGYYTVRFTRDNLPTLGDNGHMVRRSVIQKVNRDPHTFVHIDAFAILVTMGYDTFAVVKNSIVHYTGSNVIQFVNRRVRYKHLFFDQKRGKRSYYVFDQHSKADRVNIVLYIIYSLTLVQPLLVSIRGYLAVHEIAWFLHPVMCLLMVLGYGSSEFLYQLKKILPIYKKNHV